MVNLHNDWRRRRWRERPVGVVPELAGDTDVARTVTVRDSVARARQGLTNRERGVLVCRYFLDLTEQQMAREPVRAGPTSW